MARTAPTAKDATSGSVKTPTKAFLSLTTILPMLKRSEFYEPRIRANVKERIRLANNARRRRQRRERAALQSKPDKP